MYIGLNQSPFPFINYLPVMQSAIQDKEEIRFMKQPNGTTVCSYMISAPTTFDSAMAREARGIVFNDVGRVIARPLHKFFNVNEKESTLFKNLDWTKVARVMLKRDGSMIHTVKLEEDGRNFTVKSKKSYTSDVAIHSKKWLLQRKNYVEFCSFIVNRDLTAVFEWTSPTARIVVGYKEDDMQLLHIRDNFTGEYFAEDQLKFLAEQFNIPVVESVKLIDEEWNEKNVLKLHETVEDIEGWVFQFENGDMVKLKTKWYIDRHHAMTFLRVRDIARMVVDETIDDLKAKLAGDGVDVTPIVEIEEKVVDELNKIERAIDTLYEEATSKFGQDRKSIAMTFRQHPMFGLMMQKFSGREPDVKEHFQRRVMDEMFDLRQINLLDSVAEGD